MLASNERPQERTENMKFSARLSNNKYIEIEVFESLDTFTFSYNPQGLTPEDEHVIDVLYQTMYIEWEKERTANAGA
jgi:hypothetical protein